MSKDSTVDHDKSKSVSKENFASPIFLDNISKNNDIISHSDSISSDYNIDFISNDKLISSLH